MSVHAPLTVPGLPSVPPEEPDPDDVPRWTPTRSTTPLRPCRRGPAEEELPP